jgi:two-component system, cell cycle sensor histidine kinase and response regulator CckA
MELIATHGVSVDLLLTDVMMPGGSGPDVARMLADANPRAAVLYMSGYTDDIISHRGVLEPGVRLITKPFSAEDLRAAVRTALGPAPAGTARPTDSRPREARPAA